MRKLLILSPFEVFFELRSGATEIKKGKEWI